MISNWSSTGSHSGLSASCQVFPPYKYSVDTYAVKGHQQHSQDSVLIANECTLAMTPDKQPQYWRSMRQGKSVIRVQNATMFTCHENGPLASGQIRRYPPYGTYELAEPIYISKVERLFYAAVYLFETNFMITMLVPHTY